jgi:hypothetical protein
VALWSQYRYISCTFYPFDGQHISIVNDAFTSYNSLVLLILSITHC